MSATLYGAVIDRGPESGSLSYTLGVIANNADDFGFACPSIETIARGSRCDERTVIRRLAQLEREGWLRIERKVLGGRGNVYFIDLHRLAVTVNEKSRRSPLWADMQRLMRVLNSGDKLSRKSGRLQFEKAPDSKGHIETGDLFPAEESGDKVSPENRASDGRRPGHIHAIAASAEVFEEKQGAEGYETGDTLSPDTRHPDHLTGDIGGDPFNSLTVTQPLPNRNSPLPPQAGREKVSSGLVLPEPGVRPEDVLWTRNAAIAARWVQAELGVTKRRLDETIVAALRMRLVEVRDESLTEAAQLAVRNRKRYAEDHATGNIHGNWPLSVANFFQERRWESAKHWPYTESARRSEALAKLTPEPVTAEEVAAMSADARAFYEREEAERQQRETAANEAIQAKKDERWAMVRAYVEDTASELEMIAGMEARFPEALRQLVAVPCDVFALEREILRVENELRELRPDWFFNDATKTRKLPLMSLKHLSGGVR